MPHPRAAGQSGGGWGNSVDGAATADDVEAARQNTSATTDFFPYDLGNPNEYEIREYTLMSRALLQKDLKDGFLNALVEGLDQATTNAVLFYYDTSRLSLKFQWDLNNKAGLSLLSTYKTGDVAKNYIKYTPPFGSTQKRITVFAEDLTAPESNKKTLQTIYSNKNNSGKFNPYNFKRKFN